MNGYQDRLGDYVDVAERIRIFRDRYPDGSLQPVNPAEPYRIVDLGTAVFVVYVAAAYRHPDDPRPGIGSAWEPYPGRTPYTKDSELMVAETSAWGRAIVATLAADSKKVASLDEVRARRAQTPRDERSGPESAERHPSATSGPRLASDRQKDTIGRMAQERGYQMTKPLDALTSSEASELIDILKAMPKPSKPAKTDEEPF